jgi:hypothetical protein
MRCFHRYTSIALAFVLLAGVGCTNDPTGVDAPVAAETPAEPSAEDPSMLLGGLLGGTGGLLGGVLDLVGGVVSGLLEITGLLDCSEQSYAVTRETIGPWGGSIKVGNHVLVIPRGALSKYVTIKAEQMRGSTNSVRFSPEGLRFAKPAALTMSYSNCRNVEPPKAIVYTTEGLEVLKVLFSVDLLRWMKVTAPIDHFSRYAVAY